MPTLTWIGKDKVVNHHHDVPFRVLKHEYTFESEAEMTNRTENRIIHGDNLEALKSLLPEFEGRVKCIYIDPPYNTGNEGWVYNDNVNDPRIQKWLNQVVGNQKEDFSRHDKWLCMMYPRLKLLRQLLRDDGVIYVSIDENEVHLLRILMDEIFGINHFVSQIAVVNNLKGRSDDEYIATAHEYLIVYRKTSQYITYGLPIPEEYQDDYTERDHDGEFYRLQGLRKRGSSARREDRPDMFYPFYFDPATEELSVQPIPNSIEIIPKLSDGSDGRWRWGLSTAKERIDELTARKVEGTDRYDVFQIDYMYVGGTLKTIKPKSIWLKKSLSSDNGTKIYKQIMGKKAFDNPKSMYLIRDVINQSTDKDDIILDSFAGSGTTAHAVLHLNQEDGGNRRFILIEMMDYAEDITAERVRRVMNGYKAGRNQVKGLGGGFDFYTVGEPLFLSNELLNESVEIEKIRDYVAYSEGIPTEERVGLDDPLLNAINPYLLGINQDIAWIFNYEKEQATSLDLDFLSTLRFDEKKPLTFIIYADRCLLSKEFMNKRGIVFKKIPRDITRF